MQYVIAALSEKSLRDTLNVINYPECILVLLGANTAQRQTTSVLWRICT
jgi:hypothetical protein